MLKNGSVGDLRPILELEPEPDIQDAVLSPDGRLLAYVTNEPGQAVDLFLTRFPAGVGRWQVGTEGGRTPRWARDSRELFFVAGSGPSRRTMVAVRVDSSQDPPLGEVTRLFDLGGDLELDLSDSNRFDVTPDGRRFLFARPVGRNVGHQRLLLVQNWRAELGKEVAR
jgi:dipeptidyl aminopeptidase/acylaminoacyl peptidase